MAGPILGQPNYAGVADLIVGLPNTVAKTRQAKQIDAKTAAKQAGLTTATFTKLELGASVPTQKTILAALRWLAAS
jgi:transcriptional regulator with XRE-family HTH domain